MAGVGLKRLIFLQDFTNISFNSIFILLITIILTITFFKAIVPFGREATVGIFFIITRNSGLPRTRTLFITRVLYYH